MKRRLTKSLAGVAALSTVLIATAWAGKSHHNEDHSHNASHASSEVGHHDKQKKMKDKHKEGAENRGHDSIDMNKGSHGVGHHEGGKGGHHGASVAGKSGQEGDVDRVVKVEANDAMRFVHEPFNIKNGETIKFVIANKGAVPHEFSIGTKAEHMEHGQMMMENPNMHHGPAGNAITVAPGKTATLIWAFEEARDVQAACNIPGHYQAGMHSPVKFLK